MLYQEQRRQERINKIKKLIHHPYFGLLFIGFLMVIFQSLVLFGLFSPTIIRLLGFIMINIIIGLGFSILLGYGGTGALITSGMVALTTFVFSYFLKSIGVTNIVAIVITLLVAAFIGYIILRLKGIIFTVLAVGLTFALSMVFKNATTISNDTPLIKEITILGFRLKEVHNISFFMIVVTLVIMMITTYNIIKSPTGKTMLTIQHSNKDARAMGISLFKYRLLAFIFLAIYALISGLLFVSFYQFTIVKELALIAFTINVLAAVIIGGSRSIYGVILGTIFILTLNSLVFNKIDFFIERPFASLVINSLLIITVILFYPGGLIELLKHLGLRAVNLFKKLILKWKEYRYGENC